MCGCCIWVGKWESFSFWDPTTFGFFNWPFGFALKMTFWYWGWGWISNMFYVICFFFPFAFLPTYLFYMSDFLFFLNYFSFILFSYPSTTFHSYLLYHREFILNNRHNIIGNFAPLKYMCRGGKYIKMFRIHLLCGY